jgi:hypothetical protein
MKQLFRFDGSVIMEYDGTLKEALERAVKEGICLHYADITTAYEQEKEVCGKYCLDGLQICGLDLKGAILNDVVMPHSTFIDVNLTFAKMRRMDLFGSSLISAKLFKANLYGSDLRFANLRGADLRKAFASNISLTGADMTDAIIKDMDLTDAELIGVKNMECPLSCPEEGSFYGYKKLNDRYLITLLIPADAKRSSATSNKCRCSKAEVINILDLDTKELIEEVSSDTYVPITYKMGKKVYPDYFDEFRWNECSSGIHFFCSREDALNY